MKKAIALVLAVLVLQAGGVGSRLFAYAVEDQGPDQAKVEVAKAYAKKYRVEATLPDGKKLKGNVVEFTDEGFVLRDNSRTDTSLTYSQVRVKRHRLLGTKILIGVGWGAAAAGAVLLYGMLRSSSFR